MALLEIKGLDIRYKMEGRSVLACDGVSLSVNDGDSVGIVGESGSGKSTLAMRILGLLPQDTTATDGAILFKGTDLTRLLEAPRRASAIVSRLLTERKYFFYAFAALLRSAQKAGIISL